MYCEAKEHSVGKKDEPQRVTPALTTQLKAWMKGG